MPSVMHCLRSASRLGSLVILALPASVSTSSSYRPMRPMKPVMRQSTQPTGLKGL